MKYVRLLHRYTCPKTGRAGGFGLGFWVRVRESGVFAPLIHRSTQSSWLIVRPGKWSMEVDVGAGDWRLEVEQGGQEHGKNGVAS